MVVDLVVNAWVAPRKGGPGRHKRNSRCCLSIEVTYNDGGFAGLFTLHLRVLRYLNFGIRRFEDCQGRHVLHTSVGKMRADLELDFILWLNDKLLDRRDDELCQYRRACCVELRPVRNPLVQDTILVAADRETHSPLMRDLAG